MSLINPISYQMLLYLRFKIMSSTILPLLNILVLTIFKGVFMSVIKVTSCDYADELSSVFSAAAAKAGFVPAEPPLQGELSFEVPSERRAEFISLLAKFIVTDIRDGELLRLVSLLPVDKRAGELTASRARKRLASRCTEEYFISEAETELHTYLADETGINAEGFLRFRLPGVMEDWAMAVDTAAEELAALVGAAQASPLFASLFSPFSKDGCGKLSVLLFPDGSCSVSSEIGASASFEQCPSETLLMFIASMSPSQITVFDLTEHGSVLPIMLQGAVGKRIVLYKISI